MEVSQSRQQAQNIKRKDQLFSPPSSGASAFLSTPRVLWYGLARRSVVCCGRRHLCVKALTLSPSQLTGRTGVQCHSADIARDQTQV
ncbi:hypothetical protein RRG08_066355 [Elysia crispata]|uniref:Uncharacterized protein n=1 Tax=Elysia crispata TaxID=231223 RepID=A0AAE1CUY5_9GAST|nr:hypothetical protein RRG08_066355 [Elysia crispata]